MKLFEAFEALEALNEETFTMSDDGVEKLGTFMSDDDNVDDVVDVIDPEAETEEEIKDSYVGKVILDCCVCHSKLYKDKEEVALDEEGILANVGEDCPFCYTSDGFKVVGEVAPFEEKTAEEDVVETEEEEVTESLTEGLLTEGKLKDSLKKIATRLGADGATIMRGFAELISDLIRNDALYDAAEYVENKATLKALLNGNDKVLNTCTKEDIEELKQDIEAYKNRKCDKDDDSLDEAQAGTLERPMSKLNGTLSNVLEIHQNELAALTSKEDALLFLDKIEPEVKNKSYLDIVKAKVAKLSDFKVLTFLYNIILKGDGMGKMESLTESHRADRHRLTAEIFDILAENGFDVDAQDVEDYAFAASDLAFEEYLAGPEKTVGEIAKDWFANTRANYPEDLEALTRLEEGLMDEGIVDKIKNKLNQKKIPVTELSKGDVFLYEDEYYSANIVKNNLKAGTVDIKAEVVGSVKGRGAKTTIRLDSTDTVKVLKDGANIRARTKNGVVGLEEGIFGKKEELFDVWAIINGRKSNIDWKVTRDVAEQSIEEYKADSKNAQSINAKDFKIWIEPHSKKEVDKFYNESTSIKEDINNLSLDTDDTHMEMTSDETGKVTITTEPIKNQSDDSEGETIVPVSPELEAEIVERPTEEEVSEEEVDIEEFDEASFDELGESYLKSIYENVESFKTADVSTNDSTLFVEGLITFTSGNTGKTSFEFSAKDFLKEGIYRFIGSNKELSEGRTNFELTGKITDKKFICESLTTKE